MVSHPAADRLIGALERGEELGEGPFARLGARRSEMPVTAEEAAAFDLVLEVALAWESMPARERRVVNAILESAGLPPLAA